MPPANSPKIVTLSGSPPNARDISVHPLERRDLIHQPVISGGLIGMFGCERRVVEEAEPAEPVIEADDDDAMLRQARPVVEGKSRAAAAKPAAIDPHHDRPPGAGLQAGGPHIEGQAVFALPQKCGDAVGVLRADGPEPRRRARARPGRCGLRRAPAQIADRRGGKRDAAEHGDAVFGCADELALCEGGFGCGLGWQAPAKGQSDRESCPEKDAPHDAPRLPFRGIRDPAIAAGSILARG